MIDQEISLERGLPANLDAERAILGAILLDNHAANQTDGLAEDAFFLDSHKRIIRRINAELRKGRAVDTITLEESLRERKEIDAVGGAAYLAFLTELLPRKINITEYVRSVREKWMLRRVIAVCADYSTRAADQGEQTANDLVVSADRDLLAITAEIQADRPTLGQQSLAESDRMERQRAGQEVMAYAYGIPDLDGLVGGLVPEELTVLGGRPGQGKTGLTVQLIARHCRRGVPVHAFEFEMTAGQLLRRLWAIVSGVPFRKIRHPKLQTDSDHDRILAAMAEVSEWPLVIDDIASLGIDQLVSRARIEKRKQDTRIVIVDYLQKMRFPGKTDHRYMAVTDAAVQLARLAKEEGIAVLLLSSLTEKSGMNRNSPPTLQDLRQSGDIQYEAHTALLIHREIDEQTEKPKLEGEIIVAKSRSDEQGLVRVRFNKDFVQFEGAQQ
jgi:replicative DNA helicase